jgi:hypothetical protein
VHRTQGELALYEQQYATAREEFSEELAAMRLLGDRGGIAIDLYYLGFVALGQGHHAEAAALFDESLATFRDIGLLQENVSQVLRGLGHVALEQGDHPRARRYFVESLTAAQRQVGEQQMIAAALEGLAAVAAAQGQPLRAVRLAGAAAALRERASQPAWLIEQAILIRWLAPAQQALGQEAQARAWAEGRALALEQAIAYALEEPTHG